MDISTRFDISTTPATRGARSLSVAGLQRPWRNVIEKSTSIILAKQAKCIMTNHKLTLKLNPRLKVSGFMDKNLDWELLCFNIANATKAAFLLNSAP